jgi:hypothetical protein
MESADTSADTACAKAAQSTAIAVKDVSLEKIILRTSVIETAPCLNQA